MPIKWGTGGGVEGLTKLEDGTLEVDDTVKVPQGEQFRFGDSAWLVRVADGQIGAGGGAGTSTRFGTVGPASEPGVQLGNDGVIYKAPDGSGGSKIRARFGDADNTDVILAESVPSFRQFQLMTDIPDDFYPDPAVLPIGVSHMTMGVFMYPDGEQDFRDGFEFYIDRYGSTPGARGQLWIDTPVIPPGRVPNAFGFIPTAMRYPLRPPVVDGIPDEIEEVWRPGAANYVNGFAKTAGYADAIFTRWTSGYVDVTLPFLIRNSDPTPIMGPVFPGNS